MGLWVTKNQQELPAIIYIGNVAELKRIERSDHYLEIGAAVSLTDAFAALLTEYPDLQEIARRFASPPICNAGTLCGNVANGSPIGDTMPALICLGTTLVLRSGSGSRVLALEDFYLDYMKKDLRPGEFIAALRVPRAHKGLSLRSYKIGKRYDQDISAVCAAFTIEVAAGRVRGARIAFGGMAATPRRAENCERALIGAEWTTTTVARAAQSLVKDFQPITDMRASKEYRLRIARNLLRRFHAETAAQSERNTSVWNYVG